VRVWRAIRLVAIAVITVVAIDTLRRRTWPRRISLGTCDVVTYAEATALLGRAAVRRAHDWSTGDGGSLTIDIVDHGPSPMIITTNNVHTYNGGPKQILTSPTTIGASAAGLSIKDGRLQLEWANQERIVRLTLISADAATKVDAFKSLAEQIDARLTDSAADTRSRR
jgi:hypothetical protein